MLLGYGQTGSGKTHTISSVYQGQLPTEASVDRSFTENLVTDDVARRGWWGKKEKLSFIYISIYIYICKELIYLLIILHTTNRPRRVLRWPGDLKLVVVDHVCTWALF